MEDNEHYLLGSRIVLPRSVSSSKDIVKANKRRTSDTSQASSVGDGADIITDRGGGSGTAAGAGGGGGGGAAGGAHGTSDASHNVWRPIAVPYSRETKPLTSYRLRMHGIKGKPSGNKPHSKPLVLRRSGKRLWTDTMLTPDDVSHHSLVSFSQDWGHLTAVESLDAQEERRSREASGSRRGGGTGRLGRQHTGSKPGAAGAGRPPKAPTDSPFRSGDVDLTDVAAASGVVVAFEPKHRSSDDAALGLDTDNGSVGGSGGGGGGLGGGGLSAGGGIYTSAGGEDGHHAVDVKAHVITNQSSGLATKNARYRSVHRVGQAPLFASEDSAVLSHPHGSALEHQEMMEQAQSQDKFKTRFRLLGSRLPGDMPAHMREQVSLPTPRMASRSNAFRLTLPASTVPVLLRWRRVASRIKRELQPCCEMERHPWRGFARSNSAAWIRLPPTTLC